LGPLSDSLANLTGLTLLDLSSNAFTGTLPAGWRATPDGGAAPQLSSLLLDSNALNGSLPALALPALVNATFQNNSFTGGQSGGGKFPCLAWPAASAGQGSRLCSSRASWLGACLLQIP
jgi:hypothetical protein